MAKQREMVFRKAELARQKMEEQDARRRDRAVAKSVKHRHKFMADLDRERQQQHAQKATDSKAAAAARKERKRQEAIRKKQEEEEEERVRQALRAVATQRSDELRSALGQGKAARVEELVRADDEDRQNDSRYETALNLGDEIEGITPLMKAAMYGDVASVILLLGSGAHVDGEDLRARTALYFAAANGDTAIARELLAAGATPGFFLHRFTKSSGAGGGGGSDGGGSDGGDDASFSKDLENEAPSEELVTLSPLVVAAARGHTAVLRLVLTAIDDRFRATVEKLTLGGSDAGSPKRKTSHKSVQWLAERWLDTLHTAESAMEQQKKEFLESKGRAPPRDLDTLEAIQQAAMHALAAARPPPRFPTLRPASRSASPSMSRSPSPLARLHSRSQHHARFALRKPSLRNLRSGTSSAATKTSLLSGLGNSIRNLFGGGGGGGTGTLGATAGGTALESSGEKPSEKPSLLGHIGQSMRHLMQAAGASRPELPLSALQSPALHKPARQV